MSETIPQGLSFLNFVKTGPVLIYVYSGDSLVYLNEAVKQLLGYSEHELAKMKFWDPVHSDFREQAKQIGQARQRGEVLPARSELKVLPKDGREIWIDAFSSVEIINGQRHILVGAYDITERKKAEESLQKIRDQLEGLVDDRTRELTGANQELTLQKQMLMSIISNISDGVVILNSQKEIEFINPTMEKQLGLTIERLRERLDYGRLVSRNVIIEQMLSRQQAFREEEVTLTIDGREVAFLASGTPIPDHSGVTNKGVVVFKPLSEIHKLVNRYSGAEARFSFRDIISQSGIMQETIRAAQMACNTMSTVLIEGESGTGKEMFAQAIHNQSLCADGPFVAVNCGAIPRDLIGSELFGYAEGAFTGARKGGSPGKFELAQGGTLFLDEIGDMPIEQQVALLRVLQEKQVTRLGGTKVVPVHVRVICATNRNLYSEVQKGFFRQDLYYRLNVISFRIAPLRERKEDIGLLLKHFLVHIDRHWLEHMQDIDPRVWELLQSYHWPGNVRELQNITERVVLASNGYRIEPAHLPHEILDSLNHQLPQKGNRDLYHQIGIKGQMAELERNQIIDLLKLYNGNVTRVAQEMNVSRRTIHRKIKLYNIKR